MKQFLIKCINIMALYFTCCTANAQINLEFTAVNEYAFNTRQALNIIITNSYSKSFNITVAGKIKDGNGQPVAEFKTSEIVLSIGANILTPINVTLSDLQYFNQDIAEIESATGTYPSGNYTICLWTVCTTSDCNGLGPDAGSMEPRCLSIHVENPTPLLLASPENEAEIETTRPLYTWIPPSPVAGSAGLNYTMILVEMLDGQSVSDAITQNRPFFEMTGITNPSLMHPSDFPELEKGKWYAWQVQAYVGKTPLAKSEQWKFKVKKEEKKPVKPTAVLLKIKDDNIYNVKEELIFLYIEDYLKQTVKVQIQSEDGKTIFKDEENFKAERGENKFSIELKNLEIVNDKVYKLLLINARGEVYVLRFKLTNA